MKKGIIRLKNPFGDFLRENRSSRKSGLNINAKNKPFGKPHKSQRVKGIRY
jgi:hypothetical protein